MHVHCYFEFAEERRQGNPHGAVVVTRLRRVSQNTGKYRRDERERSILTKFYARRSWKFKRLACDHFEQHLWRIIG